MTTFSRGIDSLEIDGNIITVTNGNEAMSCIAPIWLVEAIVADKPNMLDITFSEEAVRFIFAALNKVARKLAPPEQFEPTFFNCPNQVALIVYDDGLIELCNSQGKRLGFRHKAYITRQIKKLISAREIIV